MKRIGIEVQRLFRKKKHGMEVVALELIKQLQELDTVNKYTIFVKEDVDRDCITATPNFEVKILPGKTYFDWEQFSLPKAVNKAGLDFLHSTCNTSACYLNTPLLLTLHDIIYLEHLSFKGSAYQNFGNLYRKIIVPRVVKKSKFIITVSDFERGQIIEQLKVPGEKVKVVYNAVNPKFNNRYQPETLQLFIQKYRLPESYMLFLGNTAPKKNTKNVIEAYVHYCRAVSYPVSLVILDYEKELIKEALQKLNAVDLFEKFVFPGFISSDEMPLMYNAASLFLYPSLRESFGLPILEAMGCGTPVITSSSSSMPEVGGQAAIYVDPYNSLDIAEKMCEALANKDMLHTLKLKGLERAGQFSWRKSAESLISVYDMM